MSWDKKVLALLISLSYGCLDVDKEVDAQSCSSYSESYIHTSFDCMDYSVDYRFCTHTGESNCVDFAPESTMGHCKARNICA